MTQAPSSAFGGLLLAARPLPLVGGPTAASFPRSAILLAVARRSLPRLLEATVVPAILFYLLVVFVNVGAAMVVALAWGVVAVVRRLVTGQPVPGILFLATVGLSVRTVVGLLSGSTFAYFVQPVATTVALAAVFLGSVLIGRPVITRLAHDFCPITDEVAGRPAVAQLFAGLTLLWAGVHVLTAATTFGMLVSLPVAAFVLVKTITCLAITIAAIVLTVIWATRIARREDLVLTPSDRGSEHGCWTDGVRA